MQALLANMEGMLEMSHTKLFAVCLGLFSLLMTGLGSDMEWRAIKSVKSASYYHAGPGMYGAVAGPEEVEAKLEIIRDRFLMFLVFGGSFAGAVVCVVLRRVWAKQSGESTREMMAAYFVVSLLSAIFCAPACLKYYFKTDSPEMAFLCSFLGAGCVWVAWEILFAIGGRLKKAATDRGWLGVKEEILGGNTQDVTSVPAKPTAVPQVPVGDKTS